MDGDGSTTIGRGNQRQRLALLAVIWLSPNRRVTRDKVLSLLWPESTAAEGRHRLSTAVYDIRRTLGSDVIRSVGDELWIPTDVALACDVIDFERAIHNGAWEAAFAAYRGPLLDGVHLPGSYEFDEWIGVHRERLRRQFAGALERLIDVRQRSGDSPGAADAARMLCDAEPHSERLALIAANAIACTGDRAEAVRLLEQHVVRMSSEMKVAAPTAVVARIRELRAALDSTAIGDSGIESAVTGAQSSASGFTVAQPAAQAESVHGLPLVSASRAARARRSPILITRALTLIAASMVLLIGGAMYVRRAAAEVESYGVLVQLTNDADARISAELANMIRAKLTEALTVIGACEKGGTLSSTEAARGRCTVNVQLSVRDSIIVASATLRARTSGASLSSAETQLRASTVDDCTSMLARELVANALVSAGNDLAAAAMRNTRSTAAAQAFLVGDAQFRHGFYPTARASFEAAVAADSTFALAHYRLSQTMLWQDVPSELASHHDSLALRFVERVQPNEQLLLRAYVAWREGGAVLADSLYRALLVRNPRHTDAWFQLGETHFHYNASRGRPIDEASGEFGRVLALDSTHWGARWHMALLSAAHDAPDARKSRFDALLVDHVDGFVATEMRLFAADSGAPLDRLAVGADATVLYDAAWRRAIFRDDLRSAESLLLTMSRGDRPRLEQNKGRYLAAAMRFGRGDVDGALTLLPLSRPSADAFEAMVIVVSATLGGDLAVGNAHPDSLRRIVAAWQSTVLSTHVKPVAFRADDATIAGTYLQGLLAATGGATDSVATYASALDAFNDPRYATRQLAEIVRAHAAYRRGDCTQTLTHLDRATSTYWLGIVASQALASDGFARLLRAQCLERQARYREAISWYGSIMRNTLYDIALRQPALRGQERVFRALGDARSADDVAMVIAQH